MTTYSLPDLTGVNPNYLQVNLPFFIYENNIKIVFENSPVFADSVRIALTDGSGTLLVKDVHWKIESSDIDQTAMSKAYLQDNNFNKKLLKSVTFMSPDMVGKQVAINVQQFYDTVPGRLFDDGTPLELTPDLIKSMITGLADLRQQVSRVNSPVTPVNHVPTLLAFDLNRELSANQVQNETVTVNTVGGGKVIRLAEGAFFGDSLVITRNGVALQKSTDYLPIMVSPLTKQTRDPGGIYQYILLIKEVTGEIEIDYHAVGGDVQPDDVKAMFELQLSIKTFLDGQVFITPETVTETPAFRALHARTLILENTMRALLSGNPTYGDATANTLTRRPIAAGDANFHWWTIANLFKVQGSDDAVTADQFKGRVFFPGAKVALSFTVDVNLNQPRNPVSITTSGLVFDPLYKLFDSVAVTAPVYPMLRVVWNNISEGLAGASLQIGLPLTALSDQMLVEDMSTAESCWLLDKTGQVITGNSGTPTAPNDSGFTLPDGVSVWSSVSASSKSVVHVPVYRPGYLVYSGSTVRLTDVATNADTTPQFNAVLPGYFPFENVTSILVTMANADASVVYDVEIPTPVMNANGTSKSGKQDITSSINEMLSMKATLSKVSGAVRLAINVADLAANTAGQGNPNALTDRIRYVRVKV